MNKVYKVISIAMIFLLVSCTGEDINANSQIEKLLADIQKLQNESLNSTLESRQKEEIYFQKISEIIPRKQAPSFYKKLYIQLENSTRKFTRQLTESQNIQQPNLYFSAQEKIIGLFGEFKTLESAKALIDMYFDKTLAIDAGHSLWVHENIMKNRNDSLLYMRELIKKNPSNKNMQGLLKLLEDK